MNKTCARCEKTVYPTEELKCLDKVWHKGCFKCQECGMTLNMRTYKGYGKLPYCESHVPKAKHTTMAETPELKRIAENTKIQSNVKYHADFERSKGKFTQVADDPETLRIKANTKIISNVAYHGDLEKKAQMEKQRQINENGELVDIPTDYQHQIESYATEMLPPVVPPSLPQKNHYQTPVQQQPHQNHHQAQQNHHQAQQNHHQAQQNHHQAQQNHHQAQQNHHQPQQNHHQAQQNHHQPQQNLPQPQQNRQYDQYYKKYDEYNNQNTQYQNDEYQNQYGYGYQNFQPAQQPKIGRIQDYDPVSDGPRAPPNTQRSSATLIYNSTSDGKRGAHQSQQQSRQIGRVTDMDPLAAEQPPANHHQANHHQTHQTQHHQNQHQPSPVQNQQVVYVAMYDYEANDSDEVSFREGDYISNVSSIDEGWMTGQVLRTGHTGMLPANYVEQLKTKPAY